MLKLLVDHDKNDKYVLDVNEVFSRTKIDDNDIVKSIIKEIDKGQYLDSLRFMSRTGVALSIDCLSTGSKIALSVLYHPDEVINAREAGRNALAVMLKYLRDGSIEIRDKEYFLDLDYDTPIDILYKGYNFKNFGDFNDYMLDGFTVTPQEFMED